MWDFPLFPESASTIADQIDLVYYVLLALGGFFGIGVAAVLLYFSIKYRARARVDRSQPVSDYLPIEVAWILVPLGLSMGAFLWGAFVYFDVQRPPEEEPIEIYVVARQWMWKFQHTNGSGEINELHVPVGRPVRLIMTSQDVIHSFYVPAFRVKQDVLPGRYTDVWFEATKVGRHDLFCTEYCGTDHSRMRGYVHVMTPENYADWLRLGRGGGTEPEAQVDRDEITPERGRVELSVEIPSDTADEMAAAGAALFNELRCNVCHRTDSTQHAPSTGTVLEGLYGRKVRLRNEREIIADEQYLAESILYPNARLVQGYPPVMPTYIGQITQDELSQLVAYIKSLGDARPERAPADTLDQSPSVE